MSLVAFALPAVAHAATPDWVASGGTSAKVPTSRFLTGFALANSAQAAKNQAAADLAKKIVVRIEQTSTDVTAETNGQARYDIALITRATTDVQIANLAYQVHSDGDNHYALAYVNRGAASGQKLADRDRSVSSAKRCIADADAQKVKAAALAKFNSCRAFIAQAAEADAIVRIIAPSEAFSGKTLDEFAAMNTEIDNKVQALLQKAAASVQDAAETLAIQLHQQGLSNAARSTVSPLTYGTTSFSSVFGRTVATDLGAAIAAKKPEKATEAIKGEIVLGGTYAERGDDVLISVTARETNSGRAVAAAKTVIAKKSVPENLPIKPQNFEQALLDSKLLAEGERVDGGLRVEVWTGKGDRNLVFSEGDEVKLFMRVNQPAWVRLFYLLANKAKVPLEQGYFIDASKVNRAVEYPDSFEVSPPFGIEQIFAVAYTTEPPPLRTKKVVFDGEPYDVVDDTTLVKHRGLKKKKKKSQIAETKLTITTMPR